MGVAEPCEFELLSPLLLPDLPLPEPEESSDFDSDSDSDSDSVARGSVVVESSEVGRDDVEESSLGSLERDEELDESSPVASSLEVLWSWVRSVCAATRSPSSSVADSAGSAETLGFATGEANPSTASSAISESPESSVATARSTSS